MNEDELPERVLPPDAGPNRRALYIAQTREEIETSIVAIRHALNPRLVGRSLWLSFRRDYQQAKPGFVLSGVLVAALGAYVVGSVLRDRRNRV